MQPNIEATNSYYGYAGYFLLCSFIFNSLSLSLSLCITVVMTSRELKSFSLTASWIPGISSLTPPLHTPPNPPTPIAFLEN